LAFVGEDERRPDLPRQVIETLTACMRALESQHAPDKAAAARLLMRDLAFGPSLAISAVLLFNGLGDVDRAFGVAEAYLLERGPVLANARWRVGDASVNDQRRRKTHMMFVPVSAPMRADPRFETLMIDVGLAAYWAARGVVPDFRKP
jgi:hypothetical protein